MGEQDAFERILASLYDAMLDDSRWPGVSALVDEACGLTGNDLIVRDRESPHYARVPIRGRGPSPPGPDIGGGGIVGSILAAADQPGSANGVTERARVRRG